MVRRRAEEALNALTASVGAEPEIQQQGGAIPVPVTVNGKLTTPGAENRYRFQARKGEQLVLEVNARRLGSDLDSFLEVLDTKGYPIERAVVRPVWETSITLRDHDSAGRGIRIQAWGGLKAGDGKYLMAVGSLRGLGLLLYGAVYGALIGGVIAIGFIAVRRLRPADGAPASMGGVMKTWIPYGVALGLGTLLALALERAGALPGASV